MSSVWDRTTRVHTDPKQQIIALVRPNVIICTTETRNEFDSDCRLRSVCQLNIDFLVHLTKLCKLRTLRTVCLHTTAQIPVLFMYKGCFILGLQYQKIFKSPETFSQIGYKETHIKNSHNVLVYTSMKVTGKGNALTDRFQISASFLFVACLEYNSILKI
jgi:hypothetical protein